MKKINFYFVPSVIDDMLIGDGLKPPSRETFKNWRNGRVALNETKSGVREYPVEPKLIKDVHFTEKGEKRKTIKYSQSGYDEIKKLTKKLPKNSSLSKSK